MTTTVAAAATAHNARSKIYYSPLFVVAAAVGILFAFPARFMAEAPASLGLIFIFTFNGN
jgi:hypothetical protein